MSLAEVMAGLIFIRLSKKEEFESPAIENRD